MASVDLRPGADPVDLEAIREKARHWLSKPYGQATSQWWYSTIPRRIIIEADLREDPDTPIEDLRFHCVNGKVVALQLDLRAADGTRNAPVYGSDLNYLPWSFHTRNDAEAPLPENTDKGMAIAQRLCQLHQYVRVDLYSQGGNLYLGELTFLPTAGRREVRSPKLNEYLCAAWDPMPRVVKIT